MRKLAAGIAVACLAFTLGDDPIVHATDPASPERPSPPLSIIVKLKPAASASRIGAFLRRQGLPVARPVHEGRLRARLRKGLTDRQLAAETGRRFAARARRRPGPAAPPDLSETYVLDAATTSHGDLQALLGRLQKDPDVEWAEENKVVQISLVPNDPYFSSTGSWGQAYDDLWGLKKIGAATAWDTTAGEGVTVAVVDTGVDRTHPDLANNMWVNAGEVPGNGVDDDGNGYVDDAVGWDFVGPSYSTPTPDADPRDVHGHGTHVSGTIAAEGNNGIGVIGVAWRAKVMAVRGLDNYGYGLTAQLAAAVAYAADNGADVINASWGGPGASQVLDDAVDYAASLGVVFVAAAGNSSSDARAFHPASHAKAITVAASDSADALAYFSNYGPKIDVAAPGVDVLSLRGEGTSMGTPVGTQYTRASGTSMAAPHVAGLAALVLAGHPAFTTEQVRQVLRTSATDVGAGGWDTSFGYGRINAAQAMTIDSPLEVAIQGPPDGAHLSAPVSVSGHAGGAGFVRYELAYGAGETPTAWTTFQESTSPVDGALGTFDTATLPDGTYTLRLTAFDAAGHAYADRRQVVVDYVRITKPATPLSPALAVMVKSGVTVALEGTALGPSFLGFRVEWAAGINPPSGWSASGIVLVGNGASPVAEGPIATWDTSAIVTAGYCTLRLLVDNAGFTGEARTLVYVEPDLLSAAWPRVLHHGTWPTVAAQFTTGPAGERSLTASGPIPGGLALWKFSPDGSSLTTIDSISNTDSSPYQAATDDFDGQPGDDTILSHANYLRVFRGGGGSFTLPAASGHQLARAVAVIDDLDGVSGLEVVAPSSWQGGGTGRLQAWRSDGTPLGGAFPVPLVEQNSSLNSGGAQRLVIADVDGDGVKEIVISEGPSATTLQLRALKADGTPKPSWTTAVFDGTLYQLAAADLDGDGAFEVVALVRNADYNTVVHVLGPDGSAKPGWPVVLPLGQPAMAIGDLDRDGRNEVVVTTAYTLSVLRADGQPLSSAWPRTIGIFYVANPVIADMDGDGLPEIVLGAFRNASVPDPFLPMEAASDTGPDAGVASGTIYYEDYKILAVRRDGTVLRSWQLLGSGGMELVGLPVPSVGDVDGDGRTDIAVATAIVGAGVFFVDDSVLTVISTGSPYNPGANDWPLFRHDNGNTSVRRRDLAPPAVALTAPGDGATITDTTTVSATASDDVYVRGVQFQVDGAAVGPEDLQAPFEIAWDPRPNGIGPHVLTAVARDPAGNLTTSAPVSVVVDMDVTPPQAAITSPAGGTTVAAPVAVLVEASDDRAVTRVELYVDQSLVGIDYDAPYSFTWDPRTVGDGPHNLVARAYDESNAGASDPVGVIVAVPPTVSVTGPAGGTWGGLVTVTASASDNTGVSRVEFYAGSTLIGTDTTAPWSVVWNAQAVPDGPYSLTARAYDAAGNVGTSAGVGVTVSHSPTVSVTSPAPNTTVSAPIVVTVNASDAGGVTRVELLLDGVVAGADTEAPYAIDWNPAAHADGNHNLSARAYDTAGHIGYSVVVPVRIAVPPAVALTAPAPGASLSGLVTVTASASDNVSVWRVELLVDGVLALTDFGAPWSLNLDTSAYPDGAHTLAARAVDGAGNVGTSAPVSVTTRNPLATYDPVLRAPACATIDASCNSGALLNGRGTRGPEPNQPNTINGSCGDSSSGTYHVDESNDRIRVSTVDGSPLGYGKAAQVQATVWAHAAFSSDRLDLYYTANAQTPVWTLIGTFTPAAAGAQVINATYTLPAGGVQAVRARFRYSSVAAPCGNGSYDDVDDIVFAAEMPPDSAPPTSAITSPAAGAVLSAPTTVSVDATDDNAVVKVELYADGVLAGTDTTAPYAFTWVPSSVPDGARSLTAKAYDLVGKTTVSAALPVTVAVPPTVSVTAPAAGAVVGGMATVSASASDNGGISRVEFSVDGVVRATDTAPPYSFVWDTNAEPVGSHTLTATAYDAFTLSTTSSPVTVNVQRVAPTAVYDSALRAPRCSEPAIGCDSGTLLVGRGTKGPEPNAPNTVNSSCADGASGTFHVDESNDRIRVSTTDGTILAAGKTVRVEATVWAYSGFSSDKLDLYYAASASAPVWTFIGTLTPAGAGSQVLSATYVLPSGSLQAVRARFRWGGTSAACSVGSFDDHDDLVFAVQ